MRTYGRVEDLLGNKTWVEVQTDADGFNDYVWITTLIQVLKLDLNESPFYANYGIPAQRSVLTQVFPDFYVTNVQKLFAPRFASLIITKLEDPTPKYRINITTNAGARVATEIPV